MKVARKRNAVQEGMFYFRKDIFKGGFEKHSFSDFCASFGTCADSFSQEQLIHPRCTQTGCNPVLDGAPSAQNGLECDGANEEYTLMSIDNIINGKVIISSLLETG